MGVANSGTCTLLGIYSVRNLYTLLGIICQHYFSAFSSNLTACINMCGLFMLQKDHVAFSFVYRNEVHEL